MTFEVQNRPKTALFALKWPPNRQKAKNEKSEKKPRLYFILAHFDKFSEESPRKLPRSAANAGRRTTDYDGLRQTTTDYDGRTTNHDNRLADLRSVNLKRHVLLRSFSLASANTTSEESSMSAISGHGKSGHV